MIESIKTYLLYGSSYCGIEHTAQSDSTLGYVTLLKKRKKQVTLQDTFTFDSFVHLKQQLGSKRHAYLVINDSNVITKRVEGINLKPKQILNKAFPNINTEDFIYEVLEQESIHFVSICRKVYTQELIEKYKTVGVSVLNIALGNLVTKSITEFIDSYSYSTSNATLILEQNTITDIESLNVNSNEIYDINGLSIPFKNVLSFTSALIPVIGSEPTYSNFETSSYQLKSDFKQSRFFSQFLKFGLLFILVSLIINFLFFDYYFNQNNSLEQTSQINTATRQNVIELSEIVNTSQKKVEDMLKSKASKSSFYISSIIGTLPSSILLSELNYHPLVKSIKPNQQILYHKNELIILGTSSNRELFSEWTSDLQQLEWITSFEIFDYHDTSNALAEFGIKLELKDE